MDFDTLVWLTGLLASLSGGFLMGRYRNAAGVRRLFGDSGLLGESNVDRVRDLVGAADIGGQLPPALAAELYTILHAIDDERIAIDSREKPLT
jgi:hypothetical protein